MKIYCPTLLRVLCWMLICLPVCVSAQGERPSREAATVPVPQDRAAYQWADSVMKRLSLDEKIGQLFMIAAYSNRGQGHINEIRYLIQEYGLGGLIMMQGDPVSQVNLLNAYQQLARVPLLVSQDAEWGLGMRLKNTMSFPYNMTLGAIRDDSLIYQLGKEYARQLSGVGIHVNFAPVVDVNNNAANPVINYRSFGENKYNVARKGIMLSRGMQDHGVMACAKHFPGHGDTDSDSHFGLPLIAHDRMRLDTLELYPFVRLAQNGVASMMVAHLNIPALDTTANRASTLSPMIVRDLLQQQIGFQGLIYTDALNMEGVTKYYKPGEVDLLALQAGNDVLLFSEDVPTAVNVIREALGNQKLSVAELETKVRKILMAKYQVGLNRPGSLSTKNLGAKLNSEPARQLRRKLFEAAITLARNDRELIPLRQLEDRKIALVQVGGKPNNTFDKTLEKYGDISRFYLASGFTGAERERMMRQLSAYNTVIVGLFGMNHRASNNFGVSSETRRLLDDLDQTPAETILTVFGNPYSLKNFGKEEAVLVAYEGGEDPQRAAAMAIFGGIRIDGALPVTASPDFWEGMSFVIDQPIRFGFSAPEDQGMDSGVLARIDSVANRYIQRMAMPGCAILVARNNQIVYEKGFGKNRYGNEGRAIDPLLYTYDLASLTKVVATTLCAMRLYDENKLKLDEPLITYLPEFKGTSLAKLTPRRLLQHNAGLPAWIPYYTETYSDPRRKILSTKLYSYAPTPLHTMPVAPGLFAVPEISDSLWNRVKALKPRTTTRVRYSDVGLIILAKVVEAIVNEPLDVYVNRTFYKPMGMDHTFFNPHRMGRSEFCPPTEADTIWRHAIIQGYVNDQASALLGGVAGHAGLFSNIYDLAKLTTMLSNGGRFGSQVFLKPVTIRKFTRQQIQNSRKGLGWDKPEIFSSRPSPVSDACSPATFGHTGFTGTAIWVDPAEGLVYIFLSNRTYPYPANRLLLRENVRVRIMDQIYLAMRSFEKKMRYASHMN